MAIKGRYRIFAALFAIMALASLTTRTVLLVKSLPNLELTPLLLFKIFGVGFFFDCVTFSYLAIPFALLLVLVPDRLSNSRVGRYAKNIFLFLFTFAMLFNGVAEYIFFDEFATRFNFIAVDYLIYTTEVVKNIRESYPVNLIIGGLLLLTILPFIPLQRYLAGAFPAASTFRERFIAGLLLLALPVISFFTVDLGYCQISPNNYACELAGNGLYDLFSAFRNNELPFNKFYVTRDNQQVMAHLKELLHGSDRTGLSRTIHNGGGSHKRYNVILICEESLSAEYLGVFGNRDKITPNLDRLAGESLLFTHLYATGTRTVRGLEAITLSMPPLPGTAIVKRPHNEQIFSWGTVMRAKGYDTTFIYGGHGYFDNMNYFFANNGFNTIDRTNFADGEVTFSNAWGVCDEDLFNKTIQQANRSHAAKKPFFSFVMTTSNHRPFTYPAGKIDIPSHSGRNGGVKYADYAIGQLLAKARQEPWFRDTIFIIVADHCAGSARTVALPVKHYEIPLLVYAPEIIKPQRIDRMMSQIDIAPTILGLLHTNYSSKFFGEDILTNAAAPERAFIATYQKLGYIEGDRLLVLGPQKQADYYRFARDNGKTVELPPDDRLLDNGLAYYQGSAHAYKNRLNRTTP
jgi:phosphoglycerol transferase MdoB-like AlkP superfamily enzyme